MANFDEDWLKRNTPQSNQESGSDSLPPPKEALAKIEPVYQVSAHRLVELRRKAVTHADQLELMVRLLREAPEKLEDPKLTDGYPRLEDLQKLAVEISALKIHVDLLDEICGEDLVHLRKIAKT
jgi:hypothetical protein